MPASRPLEPQRAEPFSDRGSTFCPPTAVPMVRASPECRLKYRRRPNCRPKPSSRRSRTTWTGKPPKWPSRWIATSAPFSLKNRQWGLALWGPQRRDRGLRRRHEPRIPGIANGHRARPRCRLSPNGLTWPAAATPSPDPTTAILIVTRSGSKCAKLKADRATVAVTPLKTGAGRGRHEQHRSR